MESLGEVLKKTRERKGLSTRQVAEETRISVRYIEALEAGRYKELPGGMYNRAFLRNYADYLGLDTQSVLASFDTAATPPAEKTARARSHPPHESRDLRPNPLLIWSVMLGLSVVGLFLSRHWISGVFSPYFARPASPPAPAAGEQASRVDAPPATLPPSASGAGATPQDESATQAAGGEVPQTAPASVQTAGGTDETVPPKPLRLRFEVLEKCWVSVNSDGNRVLVKLLEPGDTQSFDAGDRFYIVLGNAGGVRLKLNDRPAKPLGKPGEVVKVLITVQNVADFLETPGS
jgi:cytoskeleton protein RodZ